MSQPNSTSPICVKCGHWHGGVGTEPGNPCTHYVESLKAECGCIASPIQMNNDPEWIRKMAAKESECESVAVGDPTTVECAWCHGTLLRKQPSVNPQELREAANVLEIVRYPWYAAKVREVADWMERRQ